MVLVFFAIWFVFFSITPGVFIPSGLFLPGLIIGSAVGLLYMQFIVYAIGVSIDKIGG
jgi:H+/Cl- antiporter ClcA